MLDRMCGWGRSSGGLVRRIFGVVLFLLVASCSGGGCSSGCGGCGGTTPLPGGFPKEKAIENAASVRVSKPGLDFVSTSLPAIASKLTNAPGGKMTIPIPTTHIEQKPAFSVIIDFDLIADICPGGPDPNANPPRCTAEVNIGASTFKIDAVTPDALFIQATIPLQLDDTPVAADVNPGPALTLHVGYGSNGTCTGPKSERVSVQPKALPVKIRIPLVAETTAPRDGYTKIDVDNAVIDLDAISGSDVRICADCGILSNIPIAGNICNPVLNAGFIKNTIVNAIKGGLDGQVKGILKDALCTAPAPNLNPPCPDGSKPDAANKHCVYNSAPTQCVPMLLGTDAHIDLGGFLKSISPGTAGGLDFGLAAGGSMDPAPRLPADNQGYQGHTPNGMTLGMVGGTIPQPVSKCVPLSDPPQLPTGIPIPDELAPTNPDTATSPHLGVALAGRFLDYTLTSVYRSGLLCLGVSTEQIDLLKSGLVSLIIPSLKKLTFEQKDAAVAIATRPQAPPTLQIGGGGDVNADPLLRIGLPKFAIDFYVWSYDRFVRAFTFQGDLSVPVNLQASKAGITPVLGEIKIANPSVSNSELLLEDPNLIAGALAPLLGGLSGQLVGGGFSPIDISGATASLGLNLEVNSFKKLTKGQDDFLAMFATFSKTTAAVGQSTTQAKLVGKQVDKDAMRLATLDRTRGPKLTVDVASSLDDGQRLVEYSYWIDKSTRSAWSTAKQLEIRDDYLFFQGRHVLYVTSRVVGMPETEDATPAAIPFTIDALAPFVEVKREGSKAAVKAWDVVSDTEALVGRYRADEGAWSDWGPLSKLGDIDVSGKETLDVEVRDEEGNVAQISQPLIRGRGDTSIGAAGSGCGCSTPGQAPARGPVALTLGVLGVLGLFAARRRRAVRPDAPSRIKLAAMALGVTTAVAATSQGCACGSEDGAPEGCGADCRQECKEALPQGLTGAYLSVAKAGDSIWVAGYNDALLATGESMLWGDLIVGRYDSGKQAVQWETVDGLPPRAEGCAEHYPGGWRRGETDSGDNVGLWTSIQMAGEKPMVSYYDATNKRLKFAFKDDGWKSYVLKEAPNTDAGRYSKMILVDGKPTVSFLLLEPGSNGSTRSKVVVARANSELPREPGDWRFEDAAVEDGGPCRGDCPGGQFCIKATGACQSAVAGCTPDCGSGQKCVKIGDKATCSAVRDPASVVTYPNAFGDYISAAPGGMVVYDRVHGNLVALIEKGGKYDRLILDGETGSRPQNTAIDTGDVGIGASLAITGAKWHVSYVNGFDESLRYISLEGGVVGRSEIVDDGTQVDGKPFPDGKHVVGDDSSIRVDGDVVRIVYQDATAGTLRLATGTPAGATRKWTLRTISQPGRFAGFFPQMIPGENKIANFWRSTDKVSKDILGDVAIVEP